MSFNDDEVMRTGVSARLAMGQLDHAVQKWALKRSTEIRRSCASCICAVKKGPFSCSLYNQVPPIDIIMNGCEEYNDEDNIPF